MKEIIVRNAEGRQITVNVVRFFRLNGMEYLIFSLNEIDEGGYVKLYVSKVVEGAGKTIEDDVEWNMIKDTIKTVIKSNKENLPLPIVDLDSNRINNLQVVDQKIFKLNDSLLQLLTANKKEEVIVVPNYQEVPQESVINVDPVVEQAIFEQQTGVNQFKVDTPVPQPMEVVQNSNTNFDRNPFTGNMTSTNNFENSTNQSTGYALDYKTLYDNELKKNEELAREIEKYKNIVNNLKNILNEIV